MTTYSTVSKNSTSYSTISKNATTFSTISKALREQFLLLENLDLLLMENGDRMILEQSVQEATQYTTVTKN